MRKIAIHWEKRLCTVENVRTCLKDFDCKIDKYANEIY